LAADAHPEVEGVELGLLVMVGKLKAGTHNCSQPWLGNLPQLKVSMGKYEKTM
jgi:hypothetical protein